MSMAFVYITTRDREEAARIARVLLQERLVACVNVLGEVDSYFSWQGHVQNEGEVVCFAKTRETLVPEVTETVQNIHSYSCPCVVALPIAGGNPEFLAWIEDSTRNPGPSQEPKEYL